MDGMVPWTTDDRTVLEVAFPGGEPRHFASIASRHACPTCGASIRVVFTLTMCLRAARTGWRPKRKCRRCGAYWTVRGHFKADTGLDAVESKG